MESLTQSLRRIRNQNAVEPPIRETTDEVEATAVSKAPQTIGESDLVGRSGFTVAQEFDGWVMAARIRKQGTQMVVDEIRLRPSDGFPTWLETSSDLGEGRAARARLDDAFWGPYLMEDDSPEGDKVEDDDDGHLTPDGGLTVKKLNAMPWGRLFRSCRHLAITAAQENEILQEWTDEPLLDRGDVIPTVRRPGRAGRDDLFYAQIAQRYVAYFDASRAPISAIASEMHYSKDTVSDWVKQARARELLTRAPNRRGGGQVTEKAQQLLAGTELP